MVSYVLGAKMAQVSRQMDKQKDDMDKILDTVRRQQDAASLLRAFTCSLLV